MTELRAGLRWGVGLLVAVALLGMPDGARGQTLASSPTPRTFGTVSVVSHTVPAESFGPYDPVFGDSYGVAFNASRYCAIPNCILSAGVQLPAGAEVLFIEVDGCDTNGANNFQVRLVRAPFHNAAITVLATANSSGNPGCVFVTAPLGTPETIDNLDNQYVLRFESPVGDNSLAFQAVRIGYRSRSARRRRSPPSPTCRRAIRSSGSSRPSPPRGSPAAAAATTSARTPR